MPVNNFEVVKATVPITDVQDQATGKKVLSGVGLSDFISIGYKDLGGEEVDMTRVIKVASWEEPVLTLDITLTELVEKLDAGYILWFWDSEGLISNNNPGIWYIGEIKQDPTAHVYFFSNNSDGDFTRFRADVDMDGNIYFYLD